MSELFIDSLCFSSVEYASLAVEYARKHNISEELVCGLKNKGLAYLSKSDYNNALSYLNEALKHATEYGLSEDLFEIHNGLGQIFRHTGDFDNAHQNFTDALQVAINQNDNENIIRGKINLGNVYAGSGDYSQALEYFTAVLDFASGEKAFQERLPVIYNSKGYIYEQLENLDSALYMYQQSYNLFDALDKNREKAIVLNNISKVMTDLGRYKEAEDNIMIADSLNKLFGNNRSKKFLYYTAHELYFNTGDYENSIYYLKKAYDFRDSINIGELNRLISELKAEHEIDILTKESELQKARLDRQKSLIGYLSVILLLVVIFISILIKLNREKTVLNRKLTLSNKEVIQKNSLINENLQYAKHIQDACMSGPIIHDVNISYFALNIPLNIVGGDFYMYRQAHGHLFFVLGDCTGHGISGGFLSVLAIQYMDIAISKFNSPAEISKYINNCYYEYFSENSTLASESLCFCIIRINPGSFTFSGSKQRVWHVSENKDLNEYKCCSFNIGSSYDISFKETTIEMNCGDVIYMSSDGYPDQFGGDNNSKLKYPQFRKILKETSELEFLSQPEYLKTRYELWKSSQYQTDDVLVLGIKKK